MFTDNKSIIFPSRSEGDLSACHCFDHPIRKDIAEYSSNEWPRHDQTESRDIARGSIDYDYTSRRDDTESWLQRKGLIDCDNSDPDSYWDINEDREPENPEKYAVVEITGDPTVWSVDEEV